MPKKLTIEEFIARARNVHGDKYDYSLITEYVNSKTKVPIRCNRCGNVFYQIPNSHISGSGCGFCGNVESHERAKKSLGDFIVQANAKHNNFYDYSLVRYVNAKTKVEIVCPKHGIFKQTPEAHINGQGCPICAQKKPISKEEFIKRSMVMHGGKYDYSMVEYKDNRHTKVKIICPIHGVFEQIPKTHMDGCGCPMCKADECATRLTLSKEFFLNKARTIHGTKYDYSKVNYINYDTKVEIICKTHGSFFQTPHLHLGGFGCPICKESKGEQSVNTFLQRNNVDFVRQYKIKNENLFSNNIYFYVDFYLPKYNVVIEYNGIQHYRPVDLFGGQEKFIQQQDRDASLRMYCNEHKIKLIEIPYTEYDNIETILKKELKFDKNKA